MHLIERQALASSSLITKPFILQKFYPLNVDKFITIHPVSKESKFYSLWQEVVNLILPYLQKENISIVQIGADKEEPLIGCIYAMGRTSVNQVSYIIGKSLLHTGADSFPVHIASSLNKKIVALYSNNFIKNVRPYFSKSEDVILLEPPRENGEKPSFTINGDRSINKIPPELIAASILKLLNIPNSINHSTLYIGPGYPNKMIHCIPNQIVNVANLGVQSLIMRMDVEFNEEKLIKQLQVCPCSILTNKPLNPAILQQFRTRILEIVYFIDKNHNPLFIKFLHNLRIPYKLFTELSEEELNKIKLDYLDFNIIGRKDISPPKELENKSANLQYKTNQFYLGRGKIYQSEYGYIKDEPLENFNNVFQIFDIKNIDLLLKEKDFIYFSEKKS